MDNYKSLYGNDESSLKSLLAQIAPKELTTTCDTIRVLSPGPTDSGPVLSFDGSVDTLDIVKSGNPLNGKHVRALDADDVDDPGHRFVESHSANGIWLAYDDGENEIFLGPRDSRTYIAKENIPSRFIADLCSILQIGHINCDYFYPARDIYLASVLNTVDSDGIFIFYLTEESKDGVIRPFAAAKGARLPEKFGFKEPSQGTIRKKAERYRAVFDKATDHAVHALRQDAGDDYADALDACRDNIFRSLRGESAPAGPVSAIHVNTSQLMVMSCLAHKNTVNKYLFVLLNPWTIDAEVFPDTKSKNSYRSDVTWTAIKSALKNDDKCNFLLDAVCGGKRYIIIPDNGFVSSLCHRLGCGRIDFSGAVGKGGHARCAYLASILSNKIDQSVSFSVRPIRSSNKKYSFCRAFSALSAGNITQQTPDEAFDFISQYMRYRNLFLRTGRFDNGTDFVVDFVLLDKRGLPVIIPDIDRELEVGVELQMSIGSKSAFRLCGVFYYKGNPFYAGAPTAQIKSLCNCSILHSKRKTASISLINNLLSGFFDGTERSDRGRKILFPSPYTYLLEQAGLLPSENGRSPFVGPGVTPRGTHKESVLRLLEMTPVEDISKEIMRFADENYETECAIYRRIGKKKIAAAARKNHGSGTMLDVFLALCAARSVGHASINYKFETMTALGSYLAIYGYRRA